MLIEIVVILLSVFPFPMSESASLLGWALIIPWGLLSGQGVMAWLPGPNKFSKIGGYFLILIVWQMVISYSMTSKANIGKEQLLFSLNPLVLWISPHHWVCYFYFYTFHLALNLLVPVFQCWCSAPRNRQRTARRRDSICGHAHVLTHTYTRTPGTLERRQC